jgi:hypothetical protein
MQSVQESIGKRRFPTFFSRRRRLPPEGVFFRIGKARQTELLRVKICGNLSFGQPDRLLVLEPCGLRDTSIGLVLRGRGCEEESE